MPLRASAVANRNASSSNSAYSFLGELNAEEDREYVQHDLDETQLIDDDSQHPPAESTEEESKFEKDLEAERVSCNSSNKSDESYSDDIDLQDLKLDVEHCESVRKVLIDNGLVDHFNSYCGGKQKPGVIEYILRRTSQFLIWTYFYHHSRDLESHSVIPWNADLIENNYTLLERFVTLYLDEIRGLTASTCYNYLCDIAKSFKWFIWYRHNRCSENPVDGISAGGFSDLINQLRKNLKPAKQKQRVANTLRKMVAKGRFPSGGIHELRQHLEDGIKWAISIDPVSVINRKVDYNRFLSIIINALYLFSAQGRIGGELQYKYTYFCYIYYFISHSGIQDIRIGQYEELVREGFVTSYNFKTVGKFIQQPITVSNVVISVLSTYVNDIRPAIQSKSNRRPNDMDRLFLTFEGLYHDQLGRLITQYFAPWSLHITSTTIRSLVETEANILKKRGDISSTDFSSLQNIGGHSEKTSEEYYIKERTCDDIEAGKRIFDKLHLNRNCYLDSGKTIDITGDNDENIVSNGLSQEPQSSDYLLSSSLTTAPQRALHIQQGCLSESSTEGQQSLVASNSGITRSKEIQSNMNPPNLTPHKDMSTSSSSSSSAICWGFNHPQFNIPPENVNARAVWSDAELDYLRDLASTFCEERY